MPDRSEMAGGGNARVATTRSAGCPHRHAVDGEGGFGARSGM